MEYSTSFREARSKVCPLLPCDRVARQPVVGGPPLLSLVPTNCIGKQCMMWTETAASDNPDEARGYCSLKVMRSLN